MNRICFVFALLPPANERGRFILVKSLQHPEGSFRAPINYIYIPEQYLLMRVISVMNILAIV